MKRGSKALQVLLKKKRVTPHTYTLEDAILSSMAGTIGDLHLLHKIAGINVHEVDLGCGVSVELSHDHSASWKKRLSDLYELAQSIAQNSVIEFDDAIIALVTADGWVLTGGRVKTPLWMTLHREVAVDDLEDDFKWLRKYVSEKR